MCKKKKYEIQTSISIGVGKADKVLDYKSLRNISV